MSYLSIAQAIAPRVGLKKPAAMATSQGPTELRLGAVIQDAVESLASRHDWQRLVRFHDFTPASETAALPADFDRFAYGETLWRTAGAAYGPVNGPVTPGTWASDTALNWVQYNGDWRLYGNAIHFSAQFPETPMSFEYITKNVIINSDGDRADFINDNDTTYLDEILVRLTATWMWKQANGLPYAEDMATAERRLETKSANDVGMTRIHFGKRREMLPDGVWSGVIGGDLANADYLEPE